MDDLLKNLFLNIVRLLLFTIDFIVETLVGHSLIYGSREERRQSEKYENSAHVLDIIWRAKRTPFMPNRLQYFLYRHAEYIHPENILRMKNVTLLAVEKDYALFTVTDPSVDVYDVPKFPFLFLSQHEQAEKLIVLPIKTFHRLADELGDPKVPVAMILITARCGSTLLTQVLARIPGVRSMSEPWATCNIHELRGSGQITPDESRRLLRSALRLHCKVEPGSGVERIFIKTTVDNAPQFADIGEMFPDFQYFFNTRHPVPSLKSMVNAIDNVLTSLHFKLGFQWRDFVAKKFSFSYDGRHDHLLKRYNRWWQNISDHEIGAMFYCNFMASYFENKKLFDNDKVIFYEDLCKDRKKELEKFFKAAGISTEHIPGALEAFERDSQNGIFTPKGKDRPRQDPDPELLETFNEYMSEMGMPQIRHEMSYEEFKKAILN